MTAFTTPQSGPCPVVTKFVKKVVRTVLCAVLLIPTGRENHSRRPQSARHAKDFAPASTLVPHRGLCGPLCYAPASTFCKYASSSAASAAFSTVAWISSSIMPRYRFRICTMAARKAVSLTFSRAATSR
jgi:hypothetical protein